MSIIIMDTSNALFVVRSASGVTIGGPYGVITTICDIEVSIIRRPNYGHIFAIAGSQKYVHKFFQHIRFPRAAPWACGRCRPRPGGRRRGGSTACGRGGISMAHWPGAWLSCPSAATPLPTGHGAPCNVASVACVLWCALVFRVCVCVAAGTRARARVRTLRRATRVAAPARQWGSHIGARPGHTLRGHVRVDCAEVAPRQFRSRIAHPSRRTSTSRNLARAPPPMRAACLPARCSFHDPTK